MTDRSYNKLPLAGEGLWEFIVLCSRHLFAFLKIFVEEAEENPLPKDSVLGF